MTGQFKKMRLATAWVLAVLMVVLIPVQAGAIALPEFSAAENQVFGTQEGNGTETEEETKPAEILAEVEEDRDQNTKHFRMDDGSFMAVQYEYPVHFQNEDGKWVDYDNTMKEVTVENTTDASAEEEDTTSASTESVTETSVTMAETNSSATENEASATDSQADTQAEIEETEAPTDAAEPALLEADESVEYENKKSDLDIHLAKKTKKNNMVKIKGDGYQVSWGFPGINKSTVEFIENQEKLEGNDKFLARKNLVQEALYREAFPNVDLQYLVTPVGIKENMILKNKNALTSFEIEYKTNGLTAVRKNDFTIELKNKDGKVIYEIYAPFMTDAKGEMSTQLQMEIKSQKNHKITVVLSADEAWLNEAKREYPVTVDPTFTKGQEWQTVECAYVDSANPTKSFGYGSATGYTGIVDIGTYGEGIYRTFIKMKNLPSLNKGDIVVDAKLNMFLKNQDFNSDMIINAHHVTASWSQSTVNWNWMSSSKRYEDIITDYDTITVSNQNNICREWNITSDIKRWYNGEANYGLLLKARTETSQCAAFYSSNYPSSSISRPVFEITYRNNKGLESYWTYTSFDAGSAGTAYINDYTGNLVFIHNDMNTSGSRLPLSIAHVYNGYSANEAFDLSPPAAGKGWRINMAQSVFPSTYNGLPDEAAKKYPYIYTDGDGTEHYFYKITNTEFLDEDGLGLSLKINQGSTNAFYVISDTKGNRLEFGFSGLLNRQYDANGNYIAVNHSSDGLKIQSIQDGAGQKIELIPNSAGLLSQMKKSENRVKTYTYSSNGFLQKIENPDKTSISFSYDSDGSLISVTDIDGYKIQFGYSTKATGKQVVSVQEYTSSNSSGQKVTFDRSKHNTEIIRTSRADGNGDIITTKQFDNYGRTISVRSESGDKTAVTSGSAYTSGEPNAAGSNLKQINKVSSEYSIGAETINLLSNHNMETSGTWKTAAWGGTNTFTAANSSEQKYIGKQSLKINSTAVTGSSSGRVYQDFTNTTLKPNQTYTLSAYVKTSGFSTTNQSYGALIGATSFNSSNVATDFYSERIQKTTDSQINGGWQRLVLTFKVPADSSKTRINLALRGITGTAYFDAVQLEEGDAPNTYNLLENSSFETYSNGMTATGWTCKQTSGGDGQYISNAENIKEGSSSYRIYGYPGANKELVQSVGISGVEEDTYILSGWAKADAIGRRPDRNFDLAVKVVYSDGTSKIKTPAAFNPTVSEWQYTSGSFDLSDGTTAVKTPVKLEVSVRYYRQANAAYFENIQLVKDTAHSFTYDSEGNLITVQKDAEQKSSMEYSNNNLTKTVDPKGYAFNYDYDLKHNLIKSTSQNDITYNYSYDTAGNPTKLEALNKNKDASILTTQEYTADKAYVSRVTDQDGNAVEFTYDNVGRITGSTDSTGTVVQSYRQDNGALTAVSKYVEDTGETVENKYTYSSTYKHLTGIQSKNTSYSFSYDAFGNRTQTKVGTQTLSTSTFGPKNGVLQKVTYGTGQYVGYTYDDFNAINSQSYNGVTAFKWLRNSANVPTGMEDLVNKIRYSYEYDVTGRLVRNSAVSTADKSKLFSLEYGYDKNNNVSRLVNNTGDKTAINDYVYGKDNLPEKYTIDNGRDVTYTYDTLNRLTKTSIATTTPLNMEYTYDLSDRNSSGSRKYQTTKISEETIAGQKYSYSYDEQGNITEIKKMVGSTYKLIRYYEYDQLSQLTYDYDYENNILRQYSYDNAGNMLSVYTSVMSSGRPVSTTSKTYGYADANWKDKLTSYDGKAITYDAIGNPLSYRDGMTMTWKNGKQLTALQKGTTAVSYTYDASGTRATKTVNGVKHTYQYVNGKLIYETRGDKSFHYYYDATGNLTAIKYRLSPTGGEYSYYVTHNWRGDINGIYNGYGNLVAQYEYDSWGNVLSVKNSSGAEITDPNNVGLLNPFRLRGYYLDTETGLYYLNNRYYDPATGRFINADIMLGANDDLNTYNLFAYCGNNPVNRYDSNGMSWEDFIYWTFHLGNTFWTIVGVDTAAFGAIFLDMQKDSKGIYHANFDCWQQYFGYNDFYDLMFDLGTSMKSAKFDFNYNGTEYILWAWKGDYINLGAGAELGIYYGGEPHWQVDKSLAMNMSLSLLYNGRLIISYTPSQKQWWITAFNPAYQYVSANNLSALFRLQFNSTGLYWAFFDKYNGKPGFAFIPELGVALIMF